MQPFQLRNQAVAKIRDYFKSQGLHEALTQTLVKSTAIEPYIDPIAVDGQVLITSPEFELKKQICLSESPGLYEIARVFRDDSLSRLHSRQFTLVEWYRREFDYLRLADDVRALVTEVSQAEVNTKSYTVEELCKEAGVVFETATSHQEISAFNQAFDEKVMPLIGACDELVCVSEYPSFLRGMAKLNENGRAMRLEVFYKGVELANGYQEIDDAEELRLLWLENNQLRRAMGKSKHPVDETLLHLTPNMKGVAGIALGLERLLMVIFAIDSIGAFDLPA